MSAPITVHAEFSDSTFSAYVECDGKVLVLTEDEFKTACGVAAFSSASLTTIWQGLMLLREMEKQAEAKSGAAT